LGGSIATDPTVTGANAFNPGILISFLGLSVNVANVGATLSLGGILSESPPGGALDIASAGTLALAGNNSYSGGTTLESGTLAVGSNTALGTGDLTVLSGTLQAGGGARVLTTAVTLDGDITISGS